MINLRDQIPNVYTDASRDMQLLVRLYELVLNYIKTNADTISSQPGTSNANILAAKAQTLGFNTKRHYSQEQLEAIVDVFPILVRSKGTMKAVTLAGNVITKAEYAVEQFKSELKVKKEPLATSYAKDALYELQEYELVLSIPEEIKDITLLLDLLPYIVPAGVPVCVERAARQNKLSI